MFIFPFTLRQLISLKAIDTEKNFTKAAKVLHTSQPALSKQILILEKNFNFLFIKRTGQVNHMIFTQKGKVFLGYSERILGLCEESCRILTDLNNKERGSIVIGISRITEIKFLCHILILFTNYLPQLSFTIELNSLRKIYTKLEQNSVDFAIIGGQIPMNFGNHLNKNYLQKPELNLISTKLHFIAGNKRIMKKSLYELDFIAFDSNSKIQKFGKMNIFLASNGINVKNLNIRLKLKSLQGVKVAISLGLGTTFLPWSSVSKEYRLNLIEILQINDLRILQNLYILNNPLNYKSKIFEIIFKKKYFKFT